MSTFPFLMRSILLSFSLAVHRCIVQTCVNDACNGQILKIRAAIKPRVLQKFRGSRSLLFVDKNFRQEILQKQTLQLSFNEVKVHFFTKVAIVIRQRMSLSQAAICYPVNRVHDN